MKRRPPKSPGRSRTYNYNDVRRLYELRKCSDPGYTKAALGRELGLSTRTVRDIINGSYERRYQLIKGRRLQEQGSEEHDDLPRSTLILGW